MKLIVWIGIFATAALGVSAQSCAIYDGNQCNSVFGRANIYVPLDTTSTYITAVDTIIDSYIDLFPEVQDQTCLDYVLFTLCLAAYLPCPGSVWCGANTKDELRSAVSSACRCDRADSCVVNGFNITTKDALIASINTGLPNYYVGSSSTGPVGDSNAVCQDVTVSGSISNMKASLMSIALVAISFSARLWLL